MVASQRDDAAAVAAAPALHQRSQATALKHVPELDGVRGLALALVLELHLVSGALGPLRRFAGIGWVGVDLFFVLSGFLITRILRGSLGSGSYFRNFYARRALRIWPVYSFVLLFAFGAARLLPPGWQADPRLLPFYLTFTQNLIGSIGFGPWALAVTWSLAVEEQFYFVFPICVRFLSRRRLCFVLLAMLFAMPLLRLAALSSGVTPMTVYMTTWFRVDTLAAGALAALLVDSPLRARIERFSVQVSACALTLAVVSCCTFFGGDILILRQSPIVGVEALVYASTFSLIAIGFAAAIVLTVSGRAVPLRRVLRSRGLRWLGRISYGAYLIHGIAIVVAQTLVKTWLQRAHVAGALLNFCVISAALGSSLALAEVSWRVFEGPVLRFRKYFPSRA